jgi:hypothetical protein
MWMKLRDAMAFLLCLGLVAASQLSALEKVPESFGPIERAGKTLSTSRHRIRIAPSGLPAGIFIRPESHELPLETRGKEPSEMLLKAIGRGQQLRAPMQIQATVEGNVTKATVTDEAKVTTENEAEVTYRSALTAGPYEVDVKVGYQFDGGITVEMTYAGVGEGGESLELVMELVGPVSQAWSGPRSDRDGIEAVAGLDPTLSSDQGETIWDSVENAEALGRDDSFVSFLQFGSPDRSFTWLCEGPDGWTRDASRPVMTIERDKSGQVSWRVRFVNHPAGAFDAKTIRFALLTHPARVKGADYRRKQWFGWPDEPEVLSIRPSALSPEKRRTLLRSVPGRETSAVVSGPGGAAMEASAGYLELRGRSGGALLSRQRDNVALFPAGLFSVLAGSSSGLPARIRSNVRENVRPGAAPRYDRQILGRALLHDIGVALEGLSQPAHYARVVRALAGFGFFERTDLETLPYWRNQDFVRYGEAFSRGSAFELTRENPAAGVYVTVYRRPRGENGYEAIFVVMNERDNAVRERLFVRRPERIFGTRNGLTAPVITKMGDFGAIPDDSDWRQSKIARRMGGRDHKAYALMDLEDNGVVLYSQSKGMDANIYGPLFIRPHNFRILYGVSE